MRNTGTGGGGGGGEGVIDGCLIEEGRRKVVVGKRSLKKGMRGTVLD